MQRTLYDSTHELFRQSFGAFVDNEIAPKHETWEAERITDKAVFRKAGTNGFLGFAVPEEFGGAGEPDFRYNAIIAEEIARVGAYGSGACIALQNDVCVPYFLSGSSDQKARWLPGICTGDLMAAVAMTEPGAGSDLAAIRTTATKDGDDYVVNGAKTFISNGIHADLLIVACKTDPAAAHRGISLLVVEADMAGFERGRRLEKIGLHAQDTAELFFSDVRVPISNRLGDEGKGFLQLVGNLPQERLSISINAVAQAEVALAGTLDYVRERHAFGQPIAKFQNTRFLLASLRTEIDIARTYVDTQILALNAGELTAVDAAKGKYWTTEMQWRVLDTCLQLHGGYGYMEEYPIARAWRDGRVQRIYGGTNEIMKDLIGKSMGL